MNEEVPQLNQEKNISFDRPDFVKEYNELNSKWKELDGFDRDLVLQGRGKQENIDIYNRKNELYSKVMDIDRYREKAKSQELQKYDVGDISNIEKIQQEKERVDNEIEKVKISIENTSTELNKLRVKLDMPPTEDIPSLMDKKENLINLLEIQKDLENKLNFEVKKQEANKSENIEQSNLEKKFLKDDIEGLSFALRGMVNNQDAFDFGIIASNLENFSDMDDLKSKLSKIVTSVESFAKNGLRDDLDALHQDAIKLSQIEASIRNLPSKIKNEEERKEFGQFISGVAGKVSDIISFIRLKSSRMQEYHNVRLPNS